MMTTPWLLVEDEDASVFFFQHVVKKLGITNELFVVRDGREAIDYVEGTGRFTDRLAFPLPGLVILDLRLPRATGFEVLERIRARPETRNLIVIMLTASGSGDDIAQAYRLGANAYLIKPLALHDLEILVRSIKDFWLTQNHAPVAVNK
ncbi:MAG: response regulator [Opitutaceae bacterium]